MVANTTESRFTWRLPQLSGVLERRRSALRLPDPWRLAGAVIILVVIPWPIWLLLFNGLTLTGYAEESTGYRYFHTLRLLYGDHERPLLPQGHLVGLFHMGIQIVLTALGYPPTELFPRVDIWAYTAVLSPILAAVVAYLWAVRILPGPGRLAVAVVLMVVIYQVRASTFWQLLQPDYCSWVHATALLAFGVMVRQAWRPGPIRLADAVVAGVFAGACISMKLTWATFPLAVTLFLLARTIVPLSVRSIVRAFAFGVVVCIVAVVVVLGVLLLYHQLDIAAVRDHISQQGRFLGQASMATSFEVWLVAQAMGRYPDVLTLTIVAPAVLLASAIFLPGRLISLSLLPGALLAIYVGYQRAYTVTYVETNSYLFLVLVVWSATVALPFVQRVAVWCRAGPRWPWLTSRIIGGLGVAALLWTVPYAAMYTTREPFITSFTASTTLTHRIEHFMHDTPGKTAVFILDNSYRPMTIHTGLAKAGGGMSVFDMTWGVSPLMDRMFPDQTYYFDVTSQAPIDLAKYDRFIFGSVATPGVSARASVPSTWTRLLSVYGIAPIGFQCDVLEDMSRYSYLTPAVIVGCERSQDRSWNIRPDQTVYMLPNAQTTEAQPVTVDRQGRQHQVEPGDIVFSLVPNGIWRAEKDGSFSRLVASPGTKVKVSNAGPWSLERQRYAGLNLTAGEGGRWVVEPVVTSPANRSSHFEEPDTNLMGPGWWVSSEADTFEVERLSDETGPFVRVRALKALTHLFVTGNDAIMGLNGVPVTFQAEIRAAPGGMQTMSVQDYGPTGDPTPYVERSLATGGWRTLVVRTGPTRGGSEKDTYTLGLVGIQPGDWFDVREFSVFLGTLPEGGANR